MYGHGLDGVLVVTRVGYARWMITKQLRDLGIENIGWVKPGTVIYEDNPMTESDIIWLREAGRPVIPYLEIHAADSCNLNCKGCTHFSNLFKTQEQYEDWDIWMKGLRQIEKHCSIFQLRIMGGEPLLNPNLADYIRHIRTCLPEADISIVTNGLLIPVQKEELFKAMKENQVGFHISIYPPTKKILCRIKDVLGQHGVKWGTTKLEVDKFTKFIHMGQNTADPFETQKKCLSKGCLFLRGGKLYKCPYEALLNEYFQYYNLPAAVNGGVDICHENINWDRLIAVLIEKPKQACEFCTQEAEYFVWENGKIPEKEDWLAREENR